MKTSKTMHEIIQYVKEECKEEKVKLNTKNIILIHIERIRFLVGLQVKLASTK